jgi:hypothetical protein
MVEGFDPDNPATVYTVHEVAEMFKMSHWTVRKNLKDKGWPHRIISKSIRFTPEDVQAIIDQSKPKPASSGRRQTLKDQLRGAA